MASEELIFESIEPSFKQQEQSAPRKHLFSPKKEKSERDLSNSKENSPRQEKQRLKAGTLNGLIEYLTDPSKCDVEFRDAFLLTYRTYMTSNELFHLLLQRIESADQPTVQFRVFSAIKSWIEDFWWSDFENNHALKDSLLKYIQKLSGPLWGPKGAQLLSTIERSITTNSKLISTNHTILQPIYPTQPLPETHQFTDFNIITVQEFARQLSIFEYSLHSKIGPSELLGQSWSSKEKDLKAPNILAVISFFNRLSNWTACNIVYHRRAENRLEALIWFINLCEELVRINNFHSAFAVKSGINSSSSRRLHRTWESLPENWNMRLGELENLFSASANYKVYRKSLSEVEPPFLPYLGIYLRDLTFIEDGNKDYLENKMVNFDKCYKVATVIAAIQQYQQMDYKTLFEPINEIQEWIFNLKHPAENELYYKSLRVEPKNVWEAYDKEVEHTELLECEISSLLQRIDTLQRRVQCLEEENLHLKGENEESFINRNRSNAEGGVRFTSPEPENKQPESRMGRKPPRRTANFTHVILNPIDHKLWDATE